MLWENLSLGQKTQNRQSATKETIWETVDSA